MKNKLELFNRTWQHRKAFLQIEKQTMGKNSFRGFFHDVDKLFLYWIFDMRTTHMIHKKYARHHAKNAKTVQDYIQMIIDFECARLTKPDMQMDAYETIKTLYPHLMDKVSVHLLLMGLRYKD